MRLRLLLLAGLLLIPACRQLAANPSVPTNAPIPSRPAASPTVIALIPTPTQTIVPVAPASTSAPLAPSTPTATDTPATYGAIAREYLENFIEEIGPRMSGSASEARAADYIQVTFEEMGYETQRQPFIFYDEDDEELNSANVIAVKEGASTQEIIVGAHYDSADDADGADDNASGVAVMVEVAQMVIDIETPYTIRFIAFGAEENDLDGSRYYVSRMNRAEIHITLDMINLDSLIAGDFDYVYGETGTPDSLRDWILRNANEAGFELEGKTAQQLDQPDGSACDCADYGPFQDAGIPFAYFEATNWELGDEDGMTQVNLRFGDRGEIRHTEFDTLDYIEETFPGRIDHRLNLYVTLLYNALTQFDLDE